MTTTYISVRRLAVKNNKKFNRRRPVFDLRTDPTGKPTRIPAGKRHLADAKIEQASMGPVYFGFVRLVYDPEHPIGNNVVAWLEITETKPEPEKE